MKYGPKWVYADGDDMWRQERKEYRDGLSYTYSKFGAFMILESNMWFSEYYYLGFMFLTLPVEMLQLSRAITKKNIATSFIVTCETVTVSEATCLKPSTSWIMDLCTFWAVFISLNQVH